MGGEQLYFRTAPVLEKYQPQRISTGGRKIKNLDRVSRPAQTIARFENTPDREFEPVVAIHAEAPGSRRGNGNSGRRLGYELVLIHIDREAGKSVVAREICPGAGIEVVNDVAVFSIHGALLRRRADHPFGNGQTGHWNICFKIPHRKSGDGAFVTHAIRAGPPGCIIERNCQPVGPKRSIARNQNFCRRGVAHQFGDRNGLQEAIGDVVVLLRKRRSKLGGNAHAIRVYQGQIVAAAVQVEAGVQRRSRHGAVLAGSKHDQK